MASLLDDRRRALEESFFAKKNEQLLDDLRAELAQADRKRALAESAGIDDENTLDLLLEADISATSIIAFKLLPLIEVAWADDSIDQRERDAILSAAEAGGIQSSEVTYQLLQNWLHQPLTEELKTAWRAYAGALAESLSESQYEAFRSEVLGKAHEVAQSAGGILGIGNKISSVEERVMADLRRAFERSG